MSTSSNPFNALPRGAKVFAIVNVLVLACCGLGGVVSAFSNNTQPSAQSVQSTPTDTPQPTANPNVGAQAYIALVSADADRISPTFTQVGTDCGKGDIALCRADLQTAHDSVASFLADLDRNPAPPCLVAADSKLREALTTYENATSLATKGIDDNDPNEVSSASTMLDTGTTQLNAATNAVSTANCS